ncbi:hypothetical protein EJ03DRAFT_116845 [Teratosphaeria nubilosa]|uniref:Uncharacterized protein n=1 Tax=Teratosphaeria nubilosa TaxID=161662 RepID=A0A6G1L7R9_9PEZI|nr:hypothetical protein EJ03DRAFT_116845 [Teratosphaeria nubilosa]
MTWTHCAVRCNGLPRSDGPIDGFARHRALLESMTSALKALVIQQYMMHALASLVPSCTCRQRHHYSIGHRISGDDPIALISLPAKSFGASHCFNLTQASLLVSGPVLPGSPSTIEMATREHDLMAIRQSKRVQEKRRLDCGSRESYTEAWNWYVGPHWGSQPRNPHRAPNAQVQEVSDAEWMGICDARGTYAENVGKKSLGWSRSQESMPPHPNWSELPRQGQQQPAGSQEAGPSIYQGSIGSGGFAQAPPFAAKRGPFQSPPQQRHTVKTPQRYFAPPPQEYFAHPPQGYFAPSPQSPIAAKLQARVAPQRSTVASEGRIDPDVPSDECYRQVLHAQHRKLLPAASRASSPPTASSGRGPTSRDWSVLLKSATEAAKQLLAEQRSNGRSSAGEAVSERHWRAFSPRLEQEMSRRLDAEDKEAWLEEFDRYITYSPQP